MIFLRIISCPDISEEITEPQIASVQLETDNCCSNSDGGDAESWTDESVSVDNEDSSAVETDKDSAVEDENMEWSIAYESSMYDHSIAVEKVPHSNITVLQWLCMNFNLFTTHPSMSKEAFSTNLQLQKVLNTTCTTHNSTYELPSTCMEARSMIDPYVVKKKVFKVCTNSCVCFRNDYNNLTVCPVCSSDRKVRFHYLPVGPRIGRIFGDVNLAQLVQAHPGSISKIANSMLMWDVHDSPAWRKNYSDEGFFEGNKNGLSFALELDGVNPFHNIGVQYSMTPIMLTLLNLPREVRNDFGNIMLVGIIPGNSESLQLEPYLEILVDELLYLTKCQMVDEYQKAPISIKIKVLLYVLDYPGLSKLFNQQRSGGLSGCHWCCIKGEHCPHLSKTIFLSNRAYLEKNSEIRKDTVNFRDKCEDNTKPPKLRVKQSEKIYRQSFDNAKNKTNANLVASATGCKGTYVLEKLPDHNRIEETQPDACHTVKDVVQNIMSIVTCKKKVDLKKVVEADKLYGRYDLNQRESVINQSDNVQNMHKKRQKKKKKVDSSKSEDPILPYTLTKDELKLADDRANSLRVPLGFGLKPSPFISKTGSLKSHDWKQLASHGILKFCLRGLLSLRCRTTLFKFFDSLSSLCAESHDLDNLEHVEKKLNESCALMERDFPLNFQNITTHILHHIVDGIRNYGPVYRTWMFVFERFNSWICKRALNMRYPEATVMETFVIFDWCQYMINSGKLPKEFKKTELECDTNIEEEKHDGELVILSKTENRALHKNCGGKCDQMNCSIRKYYFHHEIHHGTGRVIKYSSYNNSRSAMLRTNSSFVSFETDRGNPDVKVSSGKFVVFGQISYFLHHKCLSSSYHSHACIETFAEPVFDINSKLWYCGKNKNKQKFYIETKHLSPPLVTAIENELTWFIDSFKIPAC